MLRCLTWRVVSGRKLDLIVTMESPVKTVSLFLNNWETVKNIKKNGNFYIKPILQFVFFVELINEYWYIKASTTEVITCTAGSIGTVDTKVDLVRLVRCLVFVWQSFWHSELRWSPIQELVAVDVTYTLKSQPRCVIDCSLCAAPRRFNIFILAFSIHFKIIWNFLSYVIFVIFKYLFYFSHYVNKKNCCSVIRFLINCPQYYIN